MEYLNNQIHHPRDWYIPLIEIPDYFKKSNKDLKKLENFSGFNEFMYSIWRTHFQYFSPVPSIFLTEYLQKPKFLKSEKKFLVRDGLIPLLVFFNRNPKPPEGLDTKLFLNESFAQIVPDEWKPFFGTYKLNHSPPAFPHKEANIGFLFGIMSPSYCSLGYLDHCLKNIKIRLNENQLKPKKWYCYTPFGLEPIKRELSPDFNSTFVKKIVTQLEEPVQFISEIEFNKFGSFTGSIGFELNEKYLSVDSSAIHHALSSGLNLLNIEKESEQNYRSNDFEIQLSPFHGFKFSNELLVDPNEIHHISPVKEDPHEDLLEPKPINDLAFPWKAEFHNWTTRVDRVCGNVQNYSYVNLKEPETHKWKNFKSTLNLEGNDYYSPIPAIFTPVLGDELSKLKRSKKWILRDGHLPLSWFFKANPDPTEEINSKLYLNKSMYSLVPEAWRGIVKPFEYKSCKSLDEKSIKKIKRIILLTGINPNYTSHHLIREKFNKIQKVYSSLNIPLPTIEILGHYGFDPFDEFDTITFQQDFLNQLAQIFGYFPKVLSYKDYGPNCNFEDAIILEANNEVISSDNYYFHLLLSKGATPFEIKSDFNPEIDMPLSEFHGISFLDKNFATGIKHINSTIQTIKMPSTTHFNINVPVHKRYPWPEWFYTWAKTNENHHLENKVSAD